MFLEAFIVLSALCLQVVHDKLADSCLMIYNMLSGTQVA